MSWDGDWSGGEPEVELEEEEELEALETSTDEIEQMALIEEALARFPEYLNS